MIDINACLPTPEMKADFERFKTLSTQEERDAFKKEMQAKYNALPEDQREAYKKASESGLKAYAGTGSRNRNLFCSLYHRRIACLNQRCFRKPKATPHNSRLTA